jgi:hypothetical protein
MPTDNDPGRDRSPSALAIAEDCLGIAGVIQ